MDSGNCTLRQGRNSLKKMKEIDKIDAQGVMQSVLFVCIGNSGRSQLAEAMAREMFGDRVKVQSAGLRPEPMSSYTVQVLQEIGIGVGNQQAKGLDAIDMGKVGIVVTLFRGSEGSLPGAGSARLIEWPIEDPSDAAPDPASQIAAFRKARDEIRARLERFDFGAV